ncbi:hypothetical protein [Mycoplasmopsis cynos]|uniref:hypothetical protein n=1 Tax=Mycoplasmopsis cynos TaxID=171284 RepID=UPI0021FCD7A1|nr:hypothetical protein [Mycoplasmopsis cynos]UWV81404.1 hypothetical protein NW065_05740 [Mycoplasmopsis cynos]
MVNEKENKLILNTVVLKTKDLVFPGSIVEKEFLNQDDYFGFVNAKVGDSFAILFQEKGDGVNPYGVFCSFIKLVNNKTTSKKPKYSIIFKVKSFYEAEELEILYCSMIRKAMMEFMESYFHKWKLVS